LRVSQVAKVFASFFKKKPFLFAPGGPAKPSLWGRMTRHLFPVFRAFLLFTMVCGSAAANDVSIAYQRLVKAHFAINLPLPDLAIWRFDSVRPYPGGGDIVCGKVNYQNSTRVYMGMLGFYVVIRNDRVGLSGIEANNAMEDPTGAFKFAYHNLCDKH
jgi:hypothetical protein